MATTVRVVLLLALALTTVKSKTIQWANIKEAFNSVHKFSQEEPEAIPQPIWPSSGQAVPGEADPAPVPSLAWPASYGPFPKKASACTKDVCKPSNCRCSGTDIPGGLKVQDTPQMVLLSFQTSVQDQNFARYVQLFQDRKNPNGCPRTGTFFVSHNYTDYWEVQSLYAGRHEIGDNSITSPRPPLSAQQWVDQIRDERAILNRWAQVLIGDIRGFRAPYLTPGGDDMINGIQKAGMKYDSSRSTIRYMDSPNLLWPYTYDYASTQDCVVQQCPEEAHKGIWEVPLVAWKDKNSNVYATPAGCAVDNEQEALSLLTNKFMAHYNSSNRAPLAVVLDTSWMVVDYKLSATLKFMDMLNNYKDAYAVTSWQAIQWIMNPTPLAKIKSFGPWKCDANPPKVCAKDQSITCQFDEKRHLIPKGGPGTPVYRIHTCQTKCPACYPFINDPYGLKC